MRNKVILSQDLVFRIAHELRKQGKIIGFTHGAFDLFHSSHLDLLLKSAKMCDFLIVAVDSDESIQQYKSYFRPIISEKHRLNIINELNCVDATFIKQKEIFDSASMQDLYKELKPSFITIGHNYYNEKKISYDTHNSGIQLRKIDAKQDYSTTNIIEKIIALHKEKVLRERIDNISGKN